MHTRSSRSRSLAANLGAALLVLGAAGLARGLERTTSVVLTAPSCPAQVIDKKELATALRTALPPALGTEATVTPDAVGGAAYRIELACPTADAIEVTVTRAVPRAVAHDRISVADIEPAARPGTVALALAERVRVLNARAAEREGEREPTPPVANAAPADPSATPAAPTSTAPTPPAPAPPAPDVPAPDTHARRVRVTRNLAIGGAAVTVICAVIGGPLITVGNEGPPNRPAMVAAGATMLGIGGGALIVTGISFGLWLHWRHR